MKKYDISRDDWKSPINILYYKIDLYSNQHTLIDDICVATSIRELGESRDSEYIGYRSTKGYLDLKPALAYFTLSYYKDIIRS